MCSAKWKDFLTNHNCFLRNRIASIIITINWTSQFNLNSQDLFTTGPPTSKNLKSRYEPTFWKVILKRKSISSLQNSIAGEKKFDIELARSLEGKFKVISLFYRAATNEKENISIIIWHHHLTIRKLCE